MDYPIIHIDPAATDIYQEINELQDLKFGRVYKTVLCTPEH